MQEKEQEQIPLDAKLLSEAVIELNISRRSVGLYPPDHPLLKGSVERAFTYLQKLFALRPAITLGIAADTLVIDEHKLDTKNPVFREFAHSLHNKGIAAITFSASLSIDELTRLHELITAKDMPAGKDLADMAPVKGITHITLSPLDFSSFSFVEGSQKNDRPASDIWEDYIYGLLEGKLSADAEGMSLLAGIPPEEVAGTVTAAMDGHASGESYDRVITAYLQSKKGAELSSQSYSKFISFVDNLGPELKRNFLERSFGHVPQNTADVERMISDMTSEDFDRLVKVFSEHSSSVPVVLRHFIDKLSSLKEQSRGENFDFVSEKNAVVDDIELDEDIVKIFNEDKFSLFVSEDYQKDLSDMLQRSSDHRFIQLPEAEEECRAEVIDRAMLTVMIEIFESDSLSEEDYQAMSEKLSDDVDVYIEAGRFDEILAIYTTLSAHPLHGGADTTGGQKNYFHSAAFIAKFVDAVRVWGRRDREAVFRLASVLRRPVIVPLIDALLNEPDASMRKFILSVLQSIGNDVNPYVVKKLNDKRWYVIRNMLYLLRECDGSSYVSQVRKFAKHENPVICMEAVRTLLHFNTPDAVPLLRLYLQSENADLRRGAVRLSGIYRVKEAVPYLIRILEKNDLFGAEIAGKVDAVRALGEIGDRAAVKTLKKVYKTRGLFAKGNLEQLKLELFKTLENYPPDSIQELLVLGLESESEEIRSASEKLRTRETPLPPQSTEE